MWLSAPAPGSHPRLASLGPLVALIALLGGALTMGVRTTRGLEWPGIDSQGAGLDIYRDIALAQSLRDVGYGPDPVYVGERSWYNPLVPFVTAAVSAATGWPVPDAATRAGTYANLLAPLAFFLLCRALLSPWIAVCTTAGFLFLVSSSLPSWVSATYSPWFLPVNFVQALFYLTLWALVRARRHGGWLGDIVAGICWGATFLGHAAPAVLFGLVAIALAASDVATAPAAERSRTRRRAAAQLVRMAVAAVVVSSPLLVIIVGHYGLRMQHVKPSLYLDPLLGRELPRLLWAHVSIGTVVAAVGAWSVWRGRVTSELRAIVTAWIGAAGLMLAYGYVVAAARVALEWTLPILVPSFHFFFYLKASEAVLFGVGMAEAGRRLADGLARHAPSIWPAGRPTASACALTVVLVAAGLPTYVSRSDFTRERADALRVVGHDFVKASRWLRAHSRPEDVVLASDMDTTIIVGPSGAKAVAAFSAYSNPYVDHAVRVADRDALFAAITAGDVATFERLADAHDVTFAVLRTAHRDRLAAAPHPLLDEAFSSGAIAVYRVRRPARPGS